MKYISDTKRFYVVDDQNQEIGEVTFQEAGDAIYIIDHTYVDDAHRGQGIAEELVRLVVVKAEEDGRKIMPLCPFAAREFQKKPEYQKLMYVSQ